MNAGDEQHVVLREGSSIFEAIQKIDSGRIQIALVVDQNQTLLGTVTDGDVRRAILAGIDFKKSVIEIMNSQPVTAPPSCSRKTILRLMREKKVRQIPIVDNKGRVVDIELSGDAGLSGKNPHWAILMAGGLGQRLRPLTSELPKPLLNVGGRPIIETVLDNLREYGFEKFLVSVNYKGELIEAFLGDGSRWGVDIRYVHEKQKLGTAGALSLITEKPTQSVFVINADILTKVNFKNFLNFHEEEKAVATIGVREYDFQVPYGVASITNHAVTSIDEKPIHKFFVNAGLYLLEPEVLERISPDQYLDMTTFINHLVSEGSRIAAFPVHEYWLDIGRQESLDQAKIEYSNIFEAGT